MWSLVWATDGPQVLSFHPESTASETFLIFFFLLDSQASTGHLVDRLLPTDPLLCEEQK